MCKRVKKHVKRWQVEVAVPDDHWVKGYCYVSYPSLSWEDDRYYEDEVPDVILQAKADGYDKIRYRYAGAIWNYIK